MGLGHISGMVHLEWGTRVGHLQLAVDSRLAQISFHTGIVLDTYKSTLRTNVLWRSKCAAPSKLPDSIISESSQSTRETSTEIDNWFDTSHHHLYLN